VAQQRVGKNKVFVMGPYFWGSAIAILLPVGRTKFWSCDSISVGAQTQFTNHCLLVNLIKANQQVDKFKFHPLALRILRVKRHC